MTADPVGTGAGGCACVDPSCRTCPPAPSSALPPVARRRLLVRRVRLLTAATITWNAGEALGALTLGTIASSVALVGYGLDSLIEVSSAAAVAWQFAAPDPQARERAALRVVACSFFALAAYVGVEAVLGLLGSARAAPSPAGALLAAASLVVMPVLATTQRRAARELGSASAGADARQALLCTALSGVLLAGTALNALLGWAWADPVAALLIAGAAAREGRQAWRGRHCC